VLVDSSKQKWVIQKSLRSKPRTFLVGNFLLNITEWLDPVSILPPNGQAGAGVYSESLEIGDAYALGSYSTVFQSEVYAILACSEQCCNLKLRDKTICICSDSRASLLALSSYTISSSLVSQCWFSLQNLSIANRVKLFWVPGQSYIFGNDKAEELARQGSGSTFCEPEPCLPLSSSVVQQI
jgi:ribonuclease HI